MTKLTRGDRAPALDLPVFPSGRFALPADAHGKRVWLAMRRFAGCPFCNLEVHRMILGHAELEAAGVLPVVVFVATLADLAEHVGKQRAPFPLLADEDRAVHDRYGVAFSILGVLDPRNVPAMIEARSLPTGGPTRGVATLMPADFLLESDGTVGEASYGSRASEHLSVDHVLTWARSAPQGARRQPSHDK